VLVRMPANSLATASGSDPVGGVKAEVTVLDASLDLSVMPGDFVALNESTGKLDPIESFGALDVRFEDGNGESLTFEDGANGTHLDSLGHEQGLGARTADDAVVLLV
jgi:hypothetical protein